MSDELTRESIILAIQNAHYQWRTDIKVWSERTMSEYLTDDVVLPIITSTVMETMRYAAQYAALSATSSEDDDNEHVDAVLKRLQAARRAVAESRQRD